MLHFQNEGVLFSSSFLVNVRKPLEWLIIGLDHGRTPLFGNMVYSIFLQKVNRSPFDFSENWHILCECLSQYNKSKG